MKRLTSWNGKKYILPQGVGQYRKIADRLAEYENTGLEPSEIRMFQKEQCDSVKAKRVFISGPITGTEDYMERFAEAEAVLVERGYLPVNPTSFSQPLLNAHFSWEEFMEVTLCLLKQCSCICMLDGWELSRGAVLEHQFATAYNYQFITL